MQAQGFIPALKCDVADFWKDSNGLAMNNAMDQNLALYILGAPDVSQFYQALLQNTKKLSESAKKIKDAISS